ncbi:MAG: hypothetical protein QN141_10770 [Armatimonadota bacterium]|nr:hypothetical protein [Armatimonadota bacterium]MDR7451470.1 hypothetical protein [Armatimonadota bacterium]MDR7494311.1 hypothetical protein [Armatimonadota bacterium]MDR7504855.1 hypothetical protein [Armatimonadota bacterium]MDR7547257.1 hypothetical protein [Armatimonadota bacterium]
MLSLLGLLVLGPVGFLIVAFGYVIWYLASTRGEIRRLRDERMQEASQGKETRSVLGPPTLGDQADELALAARKKLREDASAMWAKAKGWWAKRR